MKFFKKIPKYIRRTYYNQLVRDKVLEQLKAKGKEFDFKKVKGLEYSSCLASKLEDTIVDVLQKLRDYDLQVCLKPEIPLEALADLMDILDSIMKHHKFDYTKLEKLREEKAQKYGTFEKGLFLEWFES